MNYSPARKDAILSQFEPDLAAKLLEFAHQISAYECDYLLFMSRKFCCLFDVLLSIGAPPVQRPIISDKVLDLDLSALRDKSVRIVDDIVICGSTMWKTRERLLKEASAKDVGTSAFCVNDRWWAKELKVPDYKAAVLSDNRAMSFCVGIVNALSIAPRPYAVDYPYFQGIEIKSSHWHRIISSKDWIPFDISSSLQTEHKVSSLTFFPTSLIIDRMRQSFGEHIFNLLDILKVRVYTENLGWGVRMSVLPIVTLKPLDSSSLSRLFRNHVDAVASHLGNRGLSTEFSTRFPSHTSKLRWLQYMAATVLGSMFGGSVQASQEKAVRLIPRDNDIEILFGGWNLETARQISDLYTSTPGAAFSSDFPVHASSVSPEQTELAALTDNNLQPRPSSGVDMHDEQRPRNIIADFNDIFIALYKNREITARQQILEASMDGNWETIRKLDRLETGLTWNGILEYLKRTFRYELSNEVKNTLSLVLDSDVDKGIAVPVLRYNSVTDLIYRAYRHGEDVLFADEEVELCGMAVTEAQQAMSSTSVPKLFLEKLLVLLIRIGATKRFLQVQYGTSGQDGVAKIGFYLHGAIAKYYQGPEQYAENDVWLSQYLEEKGVIQSIAGGGYSFKAHVPAIQVNSSSTLEARKLGGILGMVHKGTKEVDGTPVRLDDEDLVMLSTCWRLRDVAAALYIELLLFHRELFPVIARYAACVRDGKPHDPSSTRAELVNYKGYKALNSLHVKYLGWLADKPRSAKEKGARILEALGQKFAVLDWNGYWASQDILKREDEETVFSPLVQKMAELGHQMLFNVDLYEVYLTLESATNRGIDPSIDKAVECAVDKVKTFVDRTNRQKRGLLSSQDNHAFQRLSDLQACAFRDLNVSKLSVFLWQRIEHLNSEIAKILARVRTELQIFELRGDSVSYKHTLYYDIVDSTATKRIQNRKETWEYRVRVAKTKESINSVIREMEREAASDNEEVYCWNGDASSTNDAKYVFFTGRREGFSLRRVSDFLDRLFALSTSDVHFRCLVAPCDAFHSPVFRLFHKVEVDGSQFWEHLSRAIKCLSKLEKTYSRDQNVLLILGKSLTGELAKRNPKLATRAWSDAIETEIAGMAISTEAELWVF